MHTHNSVHLRGYLCDKPELRTTASNKKVTNFIIVTHKKKMEDKKYVNEADFHRVVAWQGLAEYAAKNFGNGDMVEVIGEIHNNQFEGANKKVQYVTEITANSLDHFVGTKKEMATAA